MSLAKTGFTLYFTFQRLRRLIPGLVTVKSDVAMLAFQYLFFCKSLVKKRKN